MLHRVKVLVVDDSRAVRSRLAAMIREVEGVERVCEASNADEALDLARSFMPGLVVLDLHMPGRGGFDVLRRLRAGPGPGPTVIVLTNSASEPYRRQSAVYGAAYFFDKSTEVEQLMNVVADLSRGNAQRSA
jgi:DNA-binding NarL/FixJ family response regulator